MANDWFVRKAEMLMRTSRCGCRTSLATFFSALLVYSADAAITVSSNADAGGTCPGATCTLRQAIAAATPGETITFASGLTTITLTSAELLINKNLTISGPGANLLRVQRDLSAVAFRIFNVSGNATISGLTIANGRASSGGGIFTNGTVTLINTAISDNVATGNGGGILNANQAGTTSIINSTISGNSADKGGGIYRGAVAGFGPLNVTRSTISDNSAGQGGGIHNAGGNSVTITSSTITGNDAVQGGGIYRGAPVNALNTIIARNTVTVGGAGTDVFGELTSQGYNLVGNTSGATVSGTTTGNQLNVDPMLGQLTNNGGPTMTHALLSGSSAIEGGNSSGSNTDQRGLARPVDSPVINNVGDGSDIGAYEVQADLLPGCNNISAVVTNNSNTGAGSLRGVLASVCAGSTVTFADNVRGVINLTSTELLLTKSVTISGPGANLLTVQRSFADGTQLFRIFNIVNASVIASISGLTIANGNTAESGGGLFNQATLAISSSVLSGNTAATGGAIYNNGTVTFTNSTISGNFATAGIGGGGVFNISGTVTLTNTTISGNSASDESGVAYGGGIYNLSGTASLTGSTIAGNSAQYKAGGITNSNGTVRSKNTIIALNTGPAGNPDMLGALASENFNLIGDPSGATITPAQFADQIGVTAADLKLAALQDNGGATKTHALLSGSFAIDKGHSSGTFADQRGFTRLVDQPGIASATDGNSADIGAFEFGGQPLRVISIVRSVNNIVITFEAVKGASYRLERKLAFTSASWDKIGNDLAPEAGPAVFTDTGGASVPQAIYRVRLLP